MVHFITKKKDLFKKNYDYFEIVVIFGNNIDKLFSFLVK